MRLLALLLLATGVAPAAAQVIRPAPAAGARVATLWVRCEMEGNVNFTLAVIGPTPLTDANALAAALARTFPNAEFHDPQSHLAGIFSGEVAGLLTRRGLEIEGTFDYAPLLAALDREGITDLQVAIEVPSAGFVEVSESIDFFAGLGIGRHHSRQIPLPAAAGPMIQRIAFGYHGGLAARAAPPLLLLLLGPLAVLLRRRHDLAASDRFVAWHDHLSFQRLTRAFVWSGWFVALSLFDVHAPMYFWLRQHWEAPLQWQIATLLAVAPPALVAFICHSLAAPVFLRVPEMGWTRRSVLLQGFWANAGIVGSVLAVVWLLHVVGQESPPSRWLTAGAGLVTVALISLTGWGMSINFQQPPMPDSEWRRRIEQLAEDGEVRTGKLILLPLARWRLINCFDCMTANVYLTDAILPHLTCREADAIAALELGRVWRLRSRFGWGLIQAGGLILGILVFSTLTAALLLGVNAERWWPAGGALLILYIVLTAPRPERFSARFDRDAVDLTGDPEALLTALGKLRKLSLLPLTRRDRPPSDPAVLWPRLDDLAGRRSIPHERLDEILATAGTGAGYYPPLSPTTPVQGASADSDDDRVFSAAVKQRFSNGTSWSILGIELAVPTLVLHVGQSFGPGGSAGWLFALLAYLLLVGTRKLYLFRSSSRLRRELTQRLNEKLAREGFERQSDVGYRVGFAPIEPIRIYENFYDWDIGWLIPAGERLLYLGDRVRFELPREQIERIWLGSGPPGFSGRRRVYLRWHDASRALRGVFHFDAGVEYTPWRDGPGPVSVAEQLEAWRVGPSAPDTTGLPSLPAWEPPPLAGIAPNQVSNLAGFLVLVVIRLVFAAFVAGVTGLSFSGEPLPAAWLLLAIMLAESIRPMLPFWLYRDPPSQPENVPGSEKNTMGA